MGILFVIALPIGNLQDITLRALKILQEVDIILAEDTRSFKKLEKFYQLPTKKVISFYKEVEKEREDQIVCWLKEGKKIALCSEAGTPLLSDPGGSLIRRLYREGIKILPIPGASSLTTALSVSPMDLSQGFIFLGFLPKKKGEILKKLEKIPSHLPFVIFVSPHQFHKTITLLFQALGEREVFLARELTKLHEELLLTSLSELIQRKEIRGEITLIVGPSKEENSKTKEVDLAKIMEEISSLKNLNFKPKEIAKKLKDKYKISSKALYRIVREIKD